MNELNIEYETLKQIKENYTLYYIETETEYTLVLVTPEFYYITVIDKNVDIDEVADFEKNYKNSAVSANSIDDAIALGYAALP